MSNELNLEVKLRLHRIDVPFCALFTIGLGAQTEALHVSAVFINDQWQVLAFIHRFECHWFASVDVQKPRTDRSGPCSDCLGTVAVPFFFLDTRGICLICLVLLRFALYFLILPSALC